MDEDPILQQLRSPQASGFDSGTPSTSSLNAYDIIVATPATSVSSETPKTSRKRKAPIKKLKVSEKQSISDDCSSSAAALEKAKQHLPKKHDIKLCLASLVPYPFYRQIDPAYVKKINELVESKQFDLKRTTFTVCEDPASGKYLVLDGNHRVTSFLEKFGIDCTHEFDCIVYGHLSKEQLFAISLTLTEPAMSLEMR
uniref:ParB/Sulfiredoxin domain-containing protein n=1 Tax=Panagrolaimus davidi TaxID=227884 RepID=A0A914QZ13_9BILA